MRHLIDEMTTEQIDDAMEALHHRGTVGSNYRRYDEFLMCLGCATYVHPHNPTDMIKAAARNFNLGRYKKVFGHTC